MRDLSSAWTFFYKFVFPTLWIGMFAFVTLLMFIVPDSFEGNQDVRETRWFFVGATVVGGAFIYWACMRLKKVRLDGDTLVVSNYLHQIEVPLRDVESVSGSVFVSPELIWLHLRRPGPMGDKLVFMPKLRFSLRLFRHPLVAELRSLTSNPATHA
jgi:hypothetical protein